MRIEVDEGGSKLSFFKDLYDEARAASDVLYELLDRHLEQYKGSPKIDGSAVDAKVVRNITYELIESQVAGYIPNPSVTPMVQSDTHERNAKSIETLLRNKRDELPFEKLNDMDERYSPIYGGSVWLVEWDESIVTHHTAGDVKISCLSPKRFVGQPNIYEIADMEYCFIVFETTKEDIERKYHVTPTVADETESDEHADDRTATLYVCYYKDDEDRICEYIWSADTELLDMEDYFARKRKVCRSCGKAEALCKCEKPDLALQDDEYEVPAWDIQLTDGRVIPAVSPVMEDGRPKTEAVTVPMLDEMGQPVFEDIGGGVMMPAQTTVEQPVMAPTKLPYYVIKDFPIVIRKNTSEEDNLFGQSDCGFIRHQQQEINKLESRIHEKLMKSGVYAMVPEGYNGGMGNGIFTDVIRVKRGEKELYDTMDLQVNISNDIAQSERQYDQAKRILGITDSYQGQVDSSAKSGKAKQIQVEQAAGRLDSKRQMKNAAYAEIDRVIFGYYLAFADEPRPATYRDADGRLQNRVFNRYDFLEQDEAGEWYYEDRYLFAADASVDTERQREAIWQENRMNFQSGAYGDPALKQTRLIFWQNMERAHYPWAGDNVERIRAEIQREQAEQRQAAQWQAALQAEQQKVVQLQGDVEKRKGYETYLQGIIDKIGGQANGG